MTRTLIKIKDPAVRQKWLEDCRDKYEEAKQELINAAEEHGARALDIDDIEVNEYDNLGLFEHAAIVQALAEDGLRYLYSEDDEVAEDDEPADASKPVKFDAAIFAAAEAGAARLKEKAK